MNKITVTNDYKEVSITMPNSDLTAQDFVDELVIPLMLALGYQEDTINDVLRID